MRGPDESIIFQVIVQYTGCYQPESLRQMEPRPGAIDYFEIDCVKTDETAPAVACVW